MALPVLPSARAAAGAVWLGPHYWANPLQDWRMLDDRTECHVSGGDRNVFWLTRELAPKPGDFTMRVRLGRIDASASLGPGWTVSEEETAEVLNTSARTVRRDWQFARAWLKRDLRRTG